MMVLALLQFYLLFISSTPSTNSQETRNVFKSCGVTCTYQSKVNQSTCFCWSTHCSKCAASLIKSNSSSTENLAQPKLQCKALEISSASICISWKFQESFTYIIQIRNREMEKNNQWDYVDRNAFNMVPVGFQIKRLEFNTDYQLKISAISVNKSLITPVYSDWITTLSKNIPVTSPQNITVYDFSLMDSENISALLSWTQAPDYPCYYDMHQLAPETRSQGELVNFLNLTEISLPFRIFHLFIETIYNITVLGKASNDTQKSESEIKIRFMTPTCLNLYNNNYTACAPDSPKITKLRFLPPDQIQLEWIPPKFISETNPIMKYEVYWDTKMSPGKNFDKEFDLLCQTVPPDHTSTTLPITELGKTYEVAISVYSIGGVSENSTDFITLPPDTTIITKTGNKSSLRSTQLLAILCGFVAMLVVAIGVACYCPCKSRAKMNSGSDTNTELGLPSENENLVYPTVGKICRKSEDKFEVAFTDFVLGKEVGHGAFGIVCKARLNLCGKRKVAVKMLKRKIPNCTEDDREQLLQEIEILKNVGTHPNIIKLIGYCTKGPKICLAVELCDKGDLLTHLRRLKQRYLEMANSISDSGIASNSSPQIKYAQLMTDDSVKSVPKEHLYANVHHYVNESVVTSIKVNNVTVTPATLISYARQIAVGMEYLAINKYVHRDLACRNILLTSDNVIKISDFGLTRDVYERNIYQKTTSGKLPIKWMAPEAILNQIYTTKSDVWSFGIVLWEITTLGNSPYPGVDNLKLLDLLTCGYRMRKPNNCSAEIYQLMNDCWISNPHSRPSFTQLKLTLEKMLECDRKYFSFAVNS